MKTKIIPFDAKMAKDIQDGKIEGRIMQANGLPANILAYDINGSDLAVRFTRKDGSEGVNEYQPDGKVQAEWCNGAEDFALVLEVPSKHDPQFKLFDKVLVRNIDTSWTPALFFQYCKIGFRVIGGEICTYCIPYEGHEHLVNTTDKPKEIC